MAVKYEIIDKIGVISEKSSGWKKELNVISWNDNKPKYDIREWDDEHSKMGKGVTFSRDELYELYLIMKDIFEEKKKDDRNYESSSDSIDILSLAED